MRICVEGNIGAGKSALLDALAPGGSHEISGATATSGAGAGAGAQVTAQVYKEPVEEWGEVLDLFYKDPVAWALPFSLRVLLGFGRVPADGLRLVERSPVACHHVFSQLLFNEGKMSHLQWDLFRDYCEALGWQPDAIVYVDTPVDACVQRVRARGRAAETSVDADYLRRVEFQYETMLKYTQVPVVRLDGTLSPAALADAARREIRLLAGLDAAADDAVAAGLSA